MYSKIKNLEIENHFIEFQTTDMLNPLRLRLLTPISYDDKFFVEERFIAAESTSNAGFEKYSCKCFKNNICITINNELVCKIYVPQKVKYLISKDLRLKGKFSLEYRKHLRNEYSREKHIFLAFNYIPEKCEKLVDKARKLCQKYSSGLYNQPILCCYFGEQNDSLYYGIIKDNIPVESGCLC
jgi:hypothetical protein